MTIQINIAEAKAKLSALIEAAERGEEVIIARNGEPAAILIAAKKRSVHPPGALRRMGWDGPPTPLEAFAPDRRDAEAADKPLAPFRRKR